MHKCRDFGNKSTLSYTRGTIFEFNSNLCVLMREYINVFTDSIIYVFDSFVSMVTDKKPLLSILFPVSGLGASFIPTSTQTVDEAVYMMEFITNATPYLKFLFLILTIVLTVLSTVLQIRKLLSNHKNKNNKNERS